MHWRAPVFVRVLWLLGFSFHIAGSLIHVLLVAAQILLCFNSFIGRGKALLKLCGACEC